MGLDPTQLIQAAQAVQATGTSRQTLIGFVPVDVRGRLGQADPNASVLEVLINDLQRLAELPPPPAGKPYIVGWLESAAAMALPNHPGPNAILTELARLAVEAAVVGVDGPTGPREAGLLPAPDGRAILDRKLLRTRLGTIEESGNVLVLRGPKKSGRSTAGAFVAWYAAQRGHTVVPVIDAATFEPVRLVQEQLQPILARPDTEHDPSTFIDPPKLEPLAETVAGWIREQVEDAHLHGRDPDQYWVIFDRLDAASQPMRDFARSLARKLCGPGVAQWARTVLCDVDPGHPHGVEVGLVATVDMRFEIDETDLGTFVDWLYLTHKGNAPPSPTRTALVRRMAVPDGLAPEERLAMLDAKAREVVAIVTGAA